MTLRERGQMIVWIAIMFPMLFLPIAGLSIDAGVLFDAKRDLQNVADGAARVGAMEISNHDLHHDDDVVVDEQQAPVAVNNYLDRISFPLANHSTRASADQNTVEVVVWRDVKPRFLSLVHIGTITIHASSRARPCAAVNGPGCDNILGPPP